MATVKEYVGAEVVPASQETGRHHIVAFVVMVAFFLVTPFVVYPVFLMKALCFGLFAAAFNLLVGYAGLLSFGHAMFLGSAGYLAAPPAQGVAGSPRGGTPPRR